MHGVCEPTPSSQRESVVLQAPRPEGAGRLRREAAPAPSRSPVTRVMTRGNYTDGGRVVAEQPQIVNVAKVEHRNG